MSARLLLRSPHRTALLTSRQVYQLDELARKRFGIPTLVLMENAGAQTARFCLETFPPSKRKQILVLCGKGNNGGDGMVAARHLANAGCHVTIFLAARERELKDEPQLQFHILKQMRLSIKTWKTKGSLKQLQQCLRKCHLVIDGLFGVGLHSAVRSPFDAIIEMVNNAKKRVVSIDIPSGLDADTGRVCGVCVRARYTVTLHACKRGLVTGDGPRFSGRVVVADISIPKSLVVKPSC